MKENRMKKENFKRDNDRLGAFVKNYSTIYIFLLVLIIILEVGFIIYWKLNVKSYSFTNITYLVSYIFLITISIAGIIFLILSKMNKLSDFLMSMVLHVYSLGILIWATTISLLDLSHNNDPIVHLTISMVISGILVISPIFFTVSNLLSIIIILIFNFINNYNYFNGIAAYLNFFVFILMVIVMSFRHYNIRMKEARINEYLWKLSHTDQLTGLGNETAYFEEADKIIKRSKKDYKEYGVLVLDVNNVKTTNDTFGHRFGCHLIVETGHALPKLFKTSKLFHVGGDEFIILLEGEDLLNIESIIKEFDSMLQYTKICFEGNELIHSVARGYFISKPTMTYKEVFQAADDLMYFNKRKVKKEYNMVIRES